MGTLSPASAIVAGFYPTFIDFTVRSDSDYGLSAEIVNASPVAG